MNSKFYFNQTWSISKKGFSIPLWASFTPDSLRSQSLKGSDFEHYSSNPNSSNSNFSNPNSSSPILFIGGVHGDEPEGVWLAEALLNSLLTQSKRRSHKTVGSFSEKKFWNHDWIIIPCLNPEGISINQRVNSSGVDLNRNFPSPDWNAESKGPRYYPGETPASEPEVQGAIRAIEIFKPQIIIHFHSWKPCVVYTGEPGKSIAESLSLHSGYPYHEDIGYPTPGSLGQYGWLSKQIPVICIEEQEGSPREHVWPRFQWALLDLLK